MSISVIIPTLNEEGCIRKVLEELPVDIIDEILIVDGNSSDKTREIAGEFEKVRILEQKGKGFGHAFRTGIKEAKGDIIILMDGDYSQNPGDILALLHQVEAGYDMAMGSRYLPGACSSDDTFIRYIGNKVLTFIFNVFYKTGFSDVLYLFVAFRAKKMKEPGFDTNGFEFCVEFLLRAHQYGLKIKEIPLKERKRYDGKSKVRALKDGVIILNELLKFKKYHNLHQP